MKASWANHGEVEVGTMGLKVERKFLELPVAGWCRSYG
jgi:hypothetical protein